MVVMLTIEAKAGGDIGHAAHRYYGGHDYGTLVANVDTVASVATHRHGRHCTKATLWLQYPPRHAGCVRTCHGGVPSLSRVSIDGHILQWSRTHADEWWARWTRMKKIVILSTVVTPASGDHEELITSVTTAGEHETSVASVCAWYSW